jgi:hypothetical protein
VSGHLHVSAVLPSRKEPPVHVGEEARWGSEPVWTTWRREDVCPRRDSTPTPQSSSPYRLCCPVSHQSVNTIMKIITVYNANYTKPTCTPNGRNPVIKCLRRWCIQPVCFKKLTFAVYSCMSVHVLALPTECCSVLIFHCSCFSCGLSSRHGCRCTCNTINR